MKYRKHKEILVSLPNHRAEEPCHRLQLQHSQADVPQPFSKHSHQRVEHPRTHQY